MEETTKYTDPLLHGLAERARSAPFPPEWLRLPAELSPLPRSTPILLGFSGGADSSVLLFLIYRYARENGAPLRLVHLHHGIRGKEADRDAVFATAVAKAYGLPLSLAYRDVPVEASERGESLETAARRARYEVFSEVMREHEIPILLTAHNADDNLETVLFRLLRGSGLSGMCGIPPVRSLPYGSVLRPLLEATRREIEDFAQENGIPFVFDSTNDDVVYTRNRLRKEVLPLLRELSPAPERAAARMTASLRKDRAFLDSLAAETLKNAERDGCLDREALRGTPDAILLRVLLTYWQSRIPRLAVYETVHLEALAELLRNGKNGTRLSLPQSTALLERGLLRISPPTAASQENLSDFTRQLCPGENPIPALGLSLCLTLEGCSSEPRHETLGENRKNIYNSATQIYIRFDTISERLGKHPLFVRPRQPGDRILTRGMHRSVRTLLNEARVPAEARKRLMVITLENEILWIPGLALRDGIRTDPCDGTDAVLSLSRLPF